MTTATTPPATQQKDVFFDHISYGFGWLNRVRNVPVPRGEPYLACSIKALVGPAKECWKLPYDLIVKGAEAQRVVRLYQEAVTAGRKVLVGFVIGDPLINSFTYQTGDRQGQSDVNLKARLLAVRWVKVDGEKVYTAPPRTDSSGAPGDTGADVAGLTGDGSVDDSRVDAPAPADAPAAA